MSLFQWKPYLFVRLEVPWKHHAPCLHLTSCDLAHHRGSRWLLSKYLKWIDFFLFFVCLELLGMMMGHESKLWCTKITRGESAGLEMKGTDLRFYLSLCVWVFCLHVCLCTACMTCSTLGGQVGLWDPLGLELDAIVSLLCVLRIEPGSSEEQPVFFTSEMLLQQRMLVWRINDGSYHLG